MENMKIMIMTDMEGCAGILNHDDWVTPAGRWYEQGRSFLTEETNAAIAGFFDAGATEIVVADAHGYGGINPELLDERVLLARGWSRLPYPFGMDNSIDALAFVGQHAKAGTPYSHITHTGWFSVIDETVNGISIGEYGELALCAMELEIPTIFASGEKALCHEAEALTPGVVTVSVKEGTLTDGLDTLDCDNYHKAKLAAVHLSPSKARKLIKAGAFEALSRLKTNQGAFHYPKLSPPYTFNKKYRKNGDKPPFEVEKTHPDSIIGLFNSQFIK